MSAVASITDPDQLTIATIRTLCIDAVQQPKLRHPGTPMAMGPVAYTLWQRFLRFDPDDLSGRTATGSSCRWGTRRRSCTRCSTSRR